MHGNVAAGCGDYPLVRPQAGGDHRRVGLGPTHQKMNIQAVIPAQVPDKGPGPVTVNIFTIPGRLL